MPEQTTVESKLELAAEAIESRQYARASKFAREVIQISPGLSLAWLLEAMSLSRLSRSKEASVAFERAINIEPDSARIHFNYAVHLSSFGESIDALREAEKAVEIDPEMADAQILANRMRENLGLPVKQVVGRVTQLGPFAMLKQVKVEAGETSSMPWIDAIEPFWTILGVFLALSSLVAMAIFIGTSGHVLLHALKHPPQTGHKLVLPLTGYLKLLATVFGYVGGLGSLAFVVIDVLNKRRSFIWMPVMFLAFCAGFSWLPLSIYLIFGRRRMA